MNIRTLAMLVLLWHGVGRPAWAVPEVKLRLENFKQQIGQVAEKIHDVVHGEQKSGIAIGQISPPPQFNANSGPGIEELLTVALEAREKGLVQKKAELSLRGEYDYIDDQGQIVVKLRLSIKDKQAKPIKEIVVDLVSTADIGQIMQPTVDLPVDGSKQLRHEKLKESIENPQAFIADNLVKPSTDSPFGVEIRAQRADSETPPLPRRPEVRDGEAFVQLDRGDEYAIVIHNNSDREIGVNITIDGLSVFAFSEVRKPDSNEPKYTHYILSPGLVQSIEGWHFRDQPPNNYHAFLVTELGKGASARATKPAQGRSA